MGRALQAPQEGDFPGGSCLLPSGKKKACVARMKLAAINSPVSDID
jgi:hypothetical protein